MSAATPRRWDTGAPQDQEEVTASVPPSAHTAEDIASWLAAQRARALARLGEIVPCAHAPLAPAVVIPLWSPDEALCVACCRASVMPGLGDYICDRCGLVDPDIYGVVVPLVGRIFLGLGLCQKCAAGGAR